MRFKDNNINIRIIDWYTNIPIYFKAYLEKSEITYKMIESDIAHAPVDAGSDKQQTKLLQSFELVFDVFSEDREECIDNYDKLLHLIRIIKPIYTEEADGSLKQDTTNLFGKLFIKSPGLPKVTSDYSDILVKVSNFSFTPNKEMGLIEVPIDRSKKDLYYESKAGMEVIPISYKISLGGMITLDTVDQMRIIKKGSTPVGTFTGGGRPSAPAAPAASSVPSAPSPAAAAPSEPPWGDFIQTDDGQLTVRIFNSVTSDSSKSLADIPISGRKRAVELCKEWDSLDKESKSINPAEIQKQIVSLTQEIDSHTGTSNEQATRVVKRSQLEAKLKRPGEITKEQEKLAGEMKGLAK